MSFVKTTAYRFVPTQKEKFELMQAQQGKLQNQSHRMPAEGFSVRLLQWSYTQKHNLSGKDWRAVLYDDVDRKTH